MVHIDMVPHSHAGRGASYWIAIRGSRMYMGSVGIGRFLARNDTLNAGCKLDCVPGGAEDPGEGSIGTNNRYKCRG